MFLPVLLWTDALAFLLIVIAAGGASGCVVPQGSAKYRTAGRRKALGRCFEYFSEVLLRVKLGIMPKRSNRSLKAAVSTALTGYCF